MREIKFRAWDDLEKKLYYPHELERFSSKRVEFWIGGAFKTRIKKQFILQQYTGLKDKNGKEIYEGDILKDNENVFYKVIFAHYIYDDLDHYGWCEQVISYPVEEFQDLIDRNLFDPDEKIPIINTDEIIGNIYENPELL